jgi:hypothetical protein
MMAEGFNTKIEGNCNINDVLKVKTDIFNYTDAPYPCYDISDKTLSTDISSIVHPFTYYTVHGENDFRQISNGAYPLYLYVIYTSRIESGILAIDPVERVAIRILNGPFPNTDEYIYSIGTYTCIQFFANDFGSKIVNGQLTVYGYNNPKVRLVAKYIPVLTTGGKIRLLKVIDARSGEPGSMAYTNRLFENSEIPFWYSYAEKHTCITDLLNDGPINISNELINVINFGDCIQNHVLIVTRNKMYFIPKYVGDKADLEEICKEIANKTLIVKFTKQAKTAYRYTYGFHGIVGAITIVYTDNTTQTFLYTPGIYESPTTTKAVLYDFNDIRLQPIDSTLTTLGYCDEIRLLLGISGTDVSMGVMLPTSSYSIVNIITRNSINTQFIYRWISSADSTPVVWDNRISQSLTIAAKMSKFVNGITYMKIHKQASYAEKTSRLLGGKYRESLIAFYNDNGMIVLRLNPYAAFRNGAINDLTVAENISWYMGNKNLTQLPYHSYDICEVDFNGFPIFTTIETWKFDEKTNTGYIQAIHGENIYKYAYSLVTWSNDETLATTIKITGRTTIGIISNENANNSGIVERGLRVTSYFITEETSNIVNIPTNVSVIGTIMSSNIYNLTNQILELSETVASLTNRVAALETMIRTEKNT